ncbi:MAG: hypothetical protein P9M00_00445 [Candidatus Tritonobacter lacicola]|nr:hypothetical protein [Candidatus Tritonobacter lacicola]
MNEITLGPILVFIIIALFILFRAKKREKYNLPALIAIEMGLLTFVLFRLLDNILQFLPRNVASLVADNYIVLLSIWALVTIACAVTGIVRYVRDRALGGLSWSIIGIILVCGLGSIAIPNYLAARSKAPQIVWQEVQSHEGGFIVAMPGSAEETKDDVKTEGGVITVTQFEVRQNQQGVVYNTSYTVYPGNYFGELSPEEVLTSVITNVVEAMKGPLISSRDIEVDGHPGKGYQFEIPDGYTAQATICFANNRLYQNLVIIPKGRTAPPSVSKYFDSFRFIADKE